MAAGAPLAELTRVEASARSVPATGATVIEARRGRVPLELSALWAYRELLYFLVWRDLKARYKQTVLGASWAIIQPVVTMVVFSVFFGRLARMPSDGLPYPLFAFAALAPWSFFAHAVGHSAGSLVGSQNLLRKVYFPRLVIPIGAVLASLVDFALTFVVLLALMAGYGIVPTARVLFIVPLLGLAFITALGAGLWLSALNVRYRDVRYVVPFLLQMWLFATPIAYPSSLVPPAWRTLYALNPMVGVVEGFRWALIGSAVAPGPLVIVSALVAAVALGFGALYFRHMEATFADVV